MRKYFYKLLAKYLSLYILPRNKVVELDPTTTLLIDRFPDGAIAFRQPGDAKPSFAGRPFLSLDAVKQVAPDYLLLNGLMHHERDIQGLLRQIHGVCHVGSRVIVTYYSSLWKPLMKLASRMGLREKMPELNWLTHGDVESFLSLEDFELLKREQRILLPLPIPLVSNFINRYLAPLPFFRLFTMVNIVVARPVGKGQPGWRPSVSIVVPARNEAGNIERIVQRVPAMGPDDELIFIEGHSTDNSWDTIRRVQEAYRSTRNMVIAQQDGKGKGDAVRKGFRLARNDILMILDADMTVPPEDLVKFYDVIVSGKGEFINGSRLVYPMENRAMKFANLIGNKFFATAFSFVLGQRIKDTLCGTKVISKKNYEKLVENRSYFGEFDPFGDFDLIFGASRMCLKIVEVPIAYRDRTYGETNISRWKHGVILLVMLLFAARKIRFI
jgi:hypothetical protein